MTAKQAFELSENQGEQKWREHIETIFEYIKSAALRGRRQCAFYRDQMDPKTVGELRSLGYLIIIEEHTAYVRWDMTATTGVTVPRTSK